MKVALGLGCDRGTPAETLKLAISEALFKTRLTPADVAGAASIDLKKDEAGLIEATHQYGFTLTFYTAAMLDAVQVPNPSETVRRYTGTSSVAEAAALLLARTDRQHLLIEKHKYCGSDGKNATVSIARINYE